MAPGHPKHWQIVQTHRLLKPIPDGWADPLADWTIHLRAAGDAEGTIGTRTRHVSQAARGLRVPPNCVSSTDLVTWCGTRAWKPETRHGYYTSLRGFFGWFSTRCGTADPSTVLPAVRRPTPPPRPVPDEVLLEAIAQAADRTRLMLYLASCAGLRAGEIAVVHSGDIFTDLDGVSLLVHGKGSYERFVPLTDWLGHQLGSACAEHGGYAFPGQIGGHLSARWVSKLCSLALPAPWTLHTARHRFATCAYRLDHDILTVQRLLGHASVATTQRYAEPEREALRATVRGVDLLNH